MSNQPNDIGVRAVWDNANFAKGNQDYISKLLMSNKATSKATGLVSKLGGAAGGTLTVGIGAAVVALAALAAGFVAVVAGGIKVVKTLSEIAVEAAPLEGIGNAFDRTAARFSVSLDAMRAAAGGTVNDFELMRQANIAVTGAGEEFGALFGQQLPVLLEGARMAAQATGQSTDFLFQSLVGGIKRTSPLLIDNTGYVIAQSEAQEELANELGITAAELSKEQKQIALLNATTKAINQTMAEFGEIQLTAADQIARAEAETANIKDMLGIALQPALKTVTGAWADMLAGISANIREGGALQEVFVKLGAVASIMADGIAAGIHLVGDAIAWISDRFSSGMSDTVENAFEWGINIVSSLAEGMVNALGSVLTWAMNAITSALTGWLSPGSPPKVAPNLDKWGMSAVGEWLKGFTEADFGVLDTLQGPLQDALGFLEQTGGIGEGKAGKMFANISKQIIEGLASGDLSAAFDTIRAKAGEFGDEIVGVAQSQLELLAATEAVTDAEEKLAKAREDAGAATDAVMSETAEYNRLLREGADPSILSAQMDQIRAAEEAERLAQANIAASEEELQAAKDQEEQAKSTLETQSKALKEMMDLQKSLAKENEQELADIGAGAGAGAGAGVGLGPLGSLGTGLSEGMDGISTMLQEKVEEMKTNIQEKLGGIWEGLKEKWATAWGPTFTEISSAWETLTSTARQFYDEKIAPMWESFTEWLDEHVSPAIEALQEVATALWDWWTANLSVLWTNFIADLEETFDFLTSIWEIIDGPLYDAMGAWLKDKLEPLKGVLETVEGLLKKVTEWLRSMAEAIRNMPTLDDFTEHSPAPLAAGLESINDEMERLSSTIPTLSADMIGLNMATSGMAPVNTSTTSNVANITMQNSFSGGIGLAQVRAIVRDVIRTEMRP